MMSTKTSVTVNTNLRCVIIRIQWDFENNFNIIEIQSQKDYVRQFVDRIPELLEASLFCEARNNYVECSSCMDRNIAIWRCIDCTLSSPVCRKCMRISHVQAPQFYTQMGFITLGQLPALAMARIQLLWIFLHAGYSLLVFFTFEPFSQLN